MKRYDILDGFRGYFLFFMLVNHLTFQGGSLLARVNHAELGYVQDAQGFIFISGLIVGVYYARGYQRDQHREIDRKILLRAATLFRYALFLVGIIVVLALLFPMTEAAWGDHMPEIYLSSPLTTIAGMVSLFYQPTYLDILPQYIVYLAACPLLIRWALKGHSQAVAVGSVLLWLAVQFALHKPLVEGIELLGQSLHPGFVTRSYFNPLAWQILFVGGLLIGCGLRTGTLDVEAWFGPQRSGFALLALGFVLFFLTYRLSITFEVMPLELLDRFEQFSNRQEFPLAYLLNFVALGYLVTWLMVSGARASSAIVRAIHRVPHLLFNARFLRFLGQHSLQVYTYHVLLVYGVLLFDQRHGPLPEAAKAAITIAAIASLALPAWLHANREQVWRRWRLAWEGLP
jgi:hypothetical protein